MEHKNDETQGAAVPKGKDETIDLEAIEARRHKRQQRQRTPSQYQASSLERQERWHEWHWSDWLEFAFVWLEFVAAGVFVVLTFGAFLGLRFRYDPTSLFPLILISGIIWAASRVIAKRLS